MIWVEDMLRVTEFDWEGEGVGDLERVGDTVLDLEFTRVVGRPVTVGVRLLLLGTAEGERVKGKEVALGEREGDLLPDGETLLVGMIVLTVLLGVTVLEACNPVGVGETRAVAETLGFKVITVTDGATVRVREVVTDLVPGRVVGKADLDLVPGRVVGSGEDVREACRVVGKPDLVTVLDTLRVRDRVTVLERLAMRVVGRAEAERVLVTLTVRLRDFVCDRLSNFVRVRVTLRVLVTDTVAVREAKACTPEGKEERSRKDTGKTPWEWRPESRAASVIQRHTTKKILLNSVILGKLIAEAWRIGEEGVRKGFGIWDEQPPKVVQPGSNFFF
jgi:hypothetical protein